jgi:hypothetical protein
MSATCELSHVLYCETQKKNCLGSFRKRMLKSGVVLFHDNARPHTAARTRTLLEHLCWELFHCRLCSPDLDPSDYHLFTYLKNWWGSQRFNNNQQLMGGVKTYAHRHTKIYSPIQVVKFRR